MITAVVGLLRSWKAMSSLRSWTRGISNIPGRINHNIVVNGTTPLISEVEEIVNIARKKDRGGGASEDDWNTEVHLQLLQLAHKTSARRRTLDMHNVKSARIEPPSLARSRLLGRIVDYVIALNPDAAITHAWRTLLPLSGAPSKSWNYNKTPPQTHRHQH